MIQDLKPFMSKHDLSSGVRWTEQLSKELEQSNFGIVCLTPDNLQSPWILFEAGALTKHVEGRACCLLLRGLSLADVSGPLSQFQNRMFSRAEFQKLLFDMNELIDGSLDKANLQMIVDKWWPDLEEEVTAALADPALDAPIEHKRDQSDMLEELLLLVRNIQRSLEARPTTELDIGFSKRSLRETLDQAFGRLSPNQLLIMQEFVTPAGTARVVDLGQLKAKYPKADVDSLLQSNLLTRRDDGVTTVHDLIAKYIFENLRG
jgi:hypothetical protein